MATFAAAMDTHAANLTTTENGRPSHRTTRNPLVDAFFKLARGLSREDLEGHVEAILEAQDPAEQANLTVDAFVLWASTRDVRGGKGERQLAHWLLVSLARRFPATVKQLLPLVPEYGSWRDVVALLESPDLPSEIQTTLIEMTATQLAEDATEGAIPSLCAKWAARPKSAHKAIAKKVAAALFPGAKHPEPLYRKAVADINRRLKTVEVDMCGQTWSEINPGAVPARCLKLNRAAFMNEKRGKEDAGESRYPGNEDRKECRERFLEYATSSDPAKRLNGRVLLPHEMVAHYSKHRSGKADVIVEAQWADMRKRLGDEMPALGNMIALSDVSGSMSGTPMEVAVALGVLISEVGAIRDRFITFSSEPKWHQMQGEWSLKEKVNSALSAEWGCNTDFQKALDLVLHACIEADVPPDEVGKLSLVVLSDMQFDAASRPLGWGYHQAPKPLHWETQHQALQRSFAEAGLKSKYNQPYPVPRVVYWNLRGDTSDFPVEADTPGVQICSGFSPNLLKLFMEDELEEMASMTPHAEPGKRAVDPSQTVRKVLDDPRYQPVREICAKVGEGPMAELVQDDFVVVDSEGASAEGR